MVKRNIRHSGSFGSLEKDMIYSDRLPVAWIIAKMIDRTHSLVSPQENEQRAMMGELPRRLKVAVELLEGLTTIFSDGEYKTDVKELTEQNDGFSVKRFSAICRLLHRKGLMLEQELELTV